MVGSITPQQNTSDTLWSPASRTVESISSQHAAGLAKLPPIKITPDQRERQTAAGKTDSLIGSQTIRTINRLVTTGAHVECNSAVSYHIFEILQDNTDISLMAIVTTL